MSAMAMRLNELAEEVEGWSEAKSGHGCCNGSGRGFSPERSGGSWSDVVRSEQRNDKPEGLGWHRSISGLSFRRGVLTTSRKDKPLPRARSCERAGC